MGGPGGGGEKGILLVGATDEGLPVADGADHVARVDEAEVGFFVEPFAFGVVDFEADVVGHPVFSRYIC